MREDLAKKLQKSFLGCCILAVSDCKEGQYEIFHQLAEVESDWVHDHMMVLINCEMFIRRIRLNWGIWELNL